MDNGIEVTEGLRFAFRDGWVTNRSWSVSSTSWGQELGAIVLSFDELKFKSLKFINWYKENPLEVKG